MNTAARAARGTRQAQPRASASRAVSSRDSFGTSAAVPRRTQTNARLGAGARYEARRAPVEAAREAAPRALGGAEAVPRVAARARPGLANALADQDALPAAYRTVEADRPPGVESRAETARESSARESTPRVDVWHRGDTRFTNAVTDTGDTKPPPQLQNPKSGARYETLPEENTVSDAVGERGEVNELKAPSRMEMKERESSTSDATSGTTGDTATFSGAPLLADISEAAETLGGINPESVTAIPEKVDPAPSTTLAAPSEVEPIPLTSTDPVSTTVAKPELQAPAELSSSKPRPVEIGTRQDPSEPIAVSSSVGNENLETTNSVEPIKLDQTKEPLTDSLPLKGSAVDSTDGTGSDEPSDSALYPELGSTEGSGTNQGSPAQDDATPQSDFDSSTGSANTGTTTPSPSRFGASNEIPYGSGTSSQPPYNFGGGRDLGRSFTKRGFQGVPRESQCGNGKSLSSKSEKKWIVQFRENVTDAVYFEAAREVHLGEASRSPDPPTLRAAAPGLRIAVLGGVSRRFKKKFAVAHRSEIESIEPDMEVKAFRRFAQSSNDVVTDVISLNRSASRPSRRSSFKSAPRESAPRPRVSCSALAQTSLSSTQWNLDRITSSGGSTLDGKFFAPECLCGRGVSVFVVDTGARVTHSEFTGRIATEYTNFVECDGDGSGAMLDDSGHGTHVSGTVLGVKSGIAKCATLHPVRVLDGDGSGKSSSIIEALDWIADLQLPSGNRKIVSMSLGGPRSNAIDTAVREMVTQGVPVIVAAGNEQSDASTTSPAGETSVIAVGSTSCYSTSQSKRCASDDVSVFSNFGASVDVYAPGDDVQSSWITGDNSFQQNSGTSMAAPLVAGACALYLEKYPNATPDDIKYAITSTSTPVTWNNNKGKGGGGMLDVGAMLKVAPR